MQRRSRRRIGGVLIICLEWAWRPGVIPVDNFIIRNIMDSLHGLILQTIRRFIIDGITRNRSMKMEGG